MALDLAAINEKKKLAVLHEYFKLCKMIYRIHSRFSYARGLQSNMLEEVKKIHSDPTILLMVKIVQKCFSNIFEGTEYTTTIIDGEKELSMTLEPLRRSSFMINRPS